MAPDLVAASRYASVGLDPSTPPDPLTEAVRDLLTGLETAIGPEAAARHLMALFSALDPADRRTVAAIILENR